MKSQNYCVTLAGPKPRSPSSLFIYQPPPRGLDPSSGDHASSWQVCPASGRSCRCRTEPTAPGTLSPGNVAMMLKKQSTEAPTCSLLSIHQQTPQKGQGVKRTILELKNHKGSKKPAWWATWPAWIVDFTETCFLVTGHNRPIFSMTT